MAIIGTLKEPGVRTLQEEEGGYIIILIIISMSFLILLGSYFLSHTLKEYLIATNHEKNVFTCYIAEAGIEIALGVISNDFYFNFQGETLEGEIGGGCYQVTLGIIEDNRRLVTSKGFFEGAEEVIHAWIFRGEADEKIQIHWVKPSLNPPGGF